MRVRRTTAEYVTSRQQAAEEASTLLSKLPIIAESADFVQARQRLTMLEERLAEVRRTVEETTARRTKILEDIAAGVANADDKGAKGALTKLRALRGEVDETDTTLPVLQDAVEKARHEVATAWKAAVGVVVPAYVSAARAANEAALEAEQRYDVACQVARRLGGALYSLSSKADRPPSSNGNVKGGRHAD